MKGMIQIYWQLLCCDNTGGGCCENLGAGLDLSIRGQELGQQLVSGFGLSTIVAVDAAALHTLTFVKRPHDVVLRRTWPTRQHAVYVTTGTATTSTCTTTTTTCTCAPPP